MAPSRYVKQLKDKNYGFNNAIKIKNGKYKEKCSENNMIFMPFVMDVYGRFESNTYELLKEISEPMAEHSGFTKQQTLNYIFTNISVTLMKSIANEIHIRTKH